MGSWAESHFIWSGELKNREAAVAGCLCGVCGVRARDVLVLVREPAVPAGVMLGV